MAVMTRRRLLKLGALVTGTVLMTSCTPATPPDQLGEVGGIAPVPGAVTFPRILHASATQVVSSCPAGICTWDATNGKLLGSVRASAEAISADHRLLASAGAHGEIAVVDATTGRVVRTLAGHPAGEITDTATNITCLEFSPDGNSLLSAAFNDSAVKVWTLATGTVAATVQVPAGSVMNASFSADGNRLALAGYSMPTQVWELSSHRLLSRAAAGAQNGSWVAITPDGAQVAQIMTDSPSVVTIFDAQTFTAIATAPTHAPATAPVFSADGSVLAYSLYGQHQLALWRARTNRVVTIDTESPANPAFGPDPGTVYSATGFNETNAQQVRSWNSNSGTLGIRFEAVN